MGLHLVQVACQLAALLLKSFQCVQSVVKFLLQLAFFAAQGLFFRQVSSAEALKLTLPTEQDRYLRLHAICTF